MDFSHFLSTAIAVFLGATIALSIFWSKLRSELRRRDERNAPKVPEGETEDERLDRAYSEAWSRADDFEKSVLDECKALPDDGGYDPTRKTSKEDNVVWARRFYKDLPFYNSFFSYSASDDDFEPIVGYLKELRLAQLEFALGGRMLDRDEELLEIERLRRNPSAVAHHLRDIRRHNLVLPIVKARLEYQRWQLNQANAIPRISK
jgi:hypothetical protein